MWHTRFKACAHAHPHTHMHTRTHAHTHMHTPCRVPPGSPRWCREAARAAAAFWVRPH